MRSRAVQITLAVTLAVLQLPLLVPFFQDLWGRPHYRFFPLFLVGVALAVWQRWPREDGEPAKGNSIVQWLSLAMGIMFMGGAAVLGSPGMAAVAAAFVIAGLLAMFAGGRSLRTLLPAWALLWLIIPPPGDLDRKFVNWLEDRTARAASPLLDLSGVSHFREGAELVLSGLRIPVSEVCYDMQLFFAVVAFTVLLVVVFTRPTIPAEIVRQSRFLEAMQMFITPHPLIPALCLVAGAAFWGGVLGIFRLWLIGVLLEQGGYDMTSGWSLQLLGYGLFVLAGALILSTDAALAFLLGPVPDMSEGRRPNPLCVLWNRLIVGMRAEREETSVAPLEDAEDIPAEDQAEELEEEEEQEEETRDERRTGFKQPAMGFNPIQFVVFCFFTCVLFARDYIFSRSPFAFLIGLPSFALALVAVIGLWEGRQNRDPQLGRRYLQTAEAAVEAGELERAEFLYRKLATLRPRDPAVHYGLALTSQKMGDEAGALKTMAKLAPEDGTGHGPAHLWMAKHLMANAGQPGRENLKRVEHHLSQALEADPEDVEANMMLGQIYLGTGRAEPAALHLEIAADEHPQFHMTLGRIYVQQGKVSRAKIKAKTARDHYREVALKDPDDIGARLMWADAETLLGRYEDAKDILVTGLEHSRDDRYRTAIANLCTIWCDALPGKNDADVTRKLQLLQEALSYAPRGLGVLERLAMMTTRRDAFGDRANMVFNEALADGVMPPSVSFILGTKATMENDFEAARRHFEDTYKATPNSPSVLNNLAWALAHVQPPESDRALALIEEAAQAEPWNAEIRETKGIILVQLGRNREAVSELESALRSLGRRPRIHAALAHAYEQLGETRLAEQHRRLIGSQAPDATEK